MTLCLCAWWECFPFFLFEGHVRFPFSYEYQDELFLLVWPLLICSQAKSTSKVIRLTQAVPSHFNLVSNWCDSTVRRRPMYFNLNRGLLAHLGIRSCRTNQKTRLLFFGSGHAKVVQWLTLTVLSAWVVCWGTRAPDWDLKAVARHMSSGLEPAFFLKIRNGFRHLC